MARERKDNKQTSWDLYEILGKEKSQGIQQYLSQAIKNCPFKRGQSNKCSKGKADKPLSICSVIGRSFQNQQAKEEKVVICPYRFPEKQMIQDITSKYFPNLSANSVITLSEVKVLDPWNNTWRFDKVILCSKNKSCGANQKPKVLALVEIQAVYISGNITNLFFFLTNNPQKSTLLQLDAQITKEVDFRFRPDYLSSAKRLLFQMIFKFPIASALGAKLFGIVQKPLWETIERLIEGGVSASNNNEGEGMPITWLVYDFDSKNQLHLIDTKETYMWQILNSLTYRDPNDPSLKEWKESIYRLLNKLIQQKTKKVSKT